MGGLHAADWMLAHMIIITKEEELHKSNNKVVYVAILLATNALNNSINFMLLVHIYFLM